MADIDIPGINGALQEYYDESKLTDLVRVSSQLLGMMKRGKFLGRGQPYPMITDPGQASLSGTYATANTNRVGATYDRFMMDSLRRLFAIGGIEKDVLLLAKDKIASFENVRNETNTKLKFLARELASTMYRGENGLCGKIKSITEGGGNTVIVVYDPADLRNLGPGARLVASATAAGATRGGGSGTVYPVTALSHELGQFTVTGTAATTSSWAVDDFLHRDGNAPAAGTPIVPSGFADWIPDDEPTSGDSWRGVDRSVNPTLLAGHRVDASTGETREAASELGARIFSNGGMGEVLLVNPLRHHILEMELDANATLEKTPASNNKTALVGYHGLRIATGAGSTRVISDPFCPFYRGYMLTMDTWKFHELGGLRQPRLVDMGGSSFLHQENADAVKFQTEAKGDLGCANPGANGVIKFAAA